MFTPGFRVRGFLDAMRRRAGADRARVGLRPRGVLVPAPNTPAELAQACTTPPTASGTIALDGNSSKRLHGGTARAGRRRNHHLRAAPRAAIRAARPHHQRGGRAALARVHALLAANRQMVPLDPPFADGATVGGVIAANSSGPRRRLYGTARDLVIGMTFATLEGKLVQSGGMVVKNVAGLDMGKLMIGSFGTLAAIAVVNFKLAPDARSGAQFPAVRSTPWPRPSRVAIAFWRARYSPPPSIC